MTGQDVDPFDLELARSAYVASPDNATISRAAWLAVSRAIVTKLTAAGRMAPRAEVIISNGHQTIAGVVVVRAQVTLSAQTLHALSTAELASIVQRDLADMLGDALEGQRNRDDR